MKKKKYNPFKMWGSYVGAILAPIGLSIWNGIQDATSLMGGIIGFSKSLLFLVKDSYFGYIPSIIAWGVVIVGFLIGWGIHSIVRKVSK